MDIYKKTDALLSSLFSHYYSAMPDFGLAPEPPIYAVYTIIRNSTHFISGSKTAESCLISISIFSPAFDPTLYNSVEDLLSLAGFIFQSARKLPGDDGFPPKIHYNMDFIADYDTV